MRRRAQLLILLVSVAATAAALSPPQYTLQRQLVHTVGRSPFVTVGEVVELGGISAIDVEVGDRQLAEGLAFLLLPEHNIGGIRVTVTVRDELGRPVVVDEHAGSQSPSQLTRQRLIKALGTNPLFVALDDSFPLATFLVQIRAEVIQFWNDNLGDPYGNSNFLATPVLAGLCRSRFFDDQVSLAFSTALRSAEPGSSEGIVPVAVHGPGSFSSFWTTELWIQLNGSDEVHLWFTPADGDTTEPLAATITTSGTEAAVHLQDVVATLFAAEGSGSIRYWAETPVQVISRTWTPAPDGGSYGQTIRGLPVDDAAWTTGLQRDPLQLVTSHRDGFRVNLGLVNSSASAASVRYRIIAAEDGHQVSAGPLQAIALAPWGMTQLNDLLDGLPTGQEELVVEVRVSAGSGTVMAYLSEVDSTTNDATYQQAHR